MVTCRTAASRSRDISTEREGETHRDRERRGETETERKRVEERQRQREARGETETERERARVRGRDTAVLFNVFAHLSLAERQKLHEGEHLSQQVSGGGPETSPSTTALCHSHSLSLSGCH